MVVGKVRLRGFRNHDDTALEFGDGTNIILGDNGQGKTNILEALSYLCLTKSFYAHSDAIVLSFGKERFEVDGVIQSDAKIEHHIHIAYVGGSRDKVYMLNGQHVDPFSSLVGRFPIVILSPEHAPITSGPPAERRKFVDLVMSQSSPRYFEDLLEYRRALKQRNKILLDARLTRSEPQSILGPWDRQVAGIGAEVMRRRKQFVEQFQSYMVSSYHQVTEDLEEPRMEYLPSVAFGETSTAEEIVSLFERELQKTRREELRMGATLVGPHRDEFGLTINGTDLRMFASQGQHKTFLIALKVGEFFYLKEQRRERPIVLLDDVFSELDERRTRGVLNFIGELSQAFVTATSQSIFEDTITVGEHYKKFFVSNGTVIYENV